MEFGTYGWIDFDKVTVNDEALADYYINTRTKWKTNVQGWPSFNHNFKLIDGLAKSDNVQYLELEISDKLNPAQQTELLDLLCENLLRNSSLSHLYIRYPYHTDLPSDIIEPLVRVINALIVRNIKLEGFGIRGGSFSPEDSARLLSQINELLVAYTDIKKLVLDFSLDANLQRTLLSTLKIHCIELHVLRIGEDSETPDDLLLEWISYIAKMPMRKVDLPLGNFAAEPRILEEMLDENTTLEYFANMRLTCTARNREQKALSREKSIAVNLVPEISHCWHESDGGFNYLADMPTEILQSILNLTDLPAILTFRTTSSYFCKFIGSSSFWRTFYCSQALCVPSELLEISDKTYGAYLYDNKSATVSTTFWEYITRAWYWTSAALKRKNNDRAYLKFHRDFIDELYKTYPELATLLWHFKSVGPNYCVGTQKVSKWISEPYTVINFCLYVDDYVIYHVIFRLVGENSISGIFIWKSYYAGGPMDYISHVFDWFHVTTIEEAISSARSMVKDIIAANTAESATNLTQNLPRPRFFHEFQWNRTINIQQQCLFDVDATINSQSSALFRALNVKHNEVSDFMKLVQSFSDKLIQPLDIAVPDYQQFRSRIERAEGNAKYVVRGHEWNFTGNMWGSITPNPSPFRLQLSKKQRKKSPIGLIHQFTRRLLNLILMPVIKSLWYQDTYDDNFAVHTFCKGGAWFGRDSPYKPKQWTSKTQKRTHPFQAYLADIWIHPDDVTIQHAVPHAWPLTAASLARRIIPSLCNANASLLHYHWDRHQHGTTSRNMEEFNSFFVHLSQFDIIPFEHVKLVRDVLAK